MTEDAAPRAPKKKPVVILHREPGWRPALSALVRGVCPRCRRGRIFTSLLHMPPECDVCGLRFEREPGYFTGAMYVSYIVAMPIFIGMFLAWRYYIPSMSFWSALAATVMCFLPFIPFVFRSSRILWIHFDRTVDAEE